MAHDNFQKHRSFAYGQLGNWSNEDTNPLQQACYSVVWRARPWWVSTSLYDLGLRAKPATSLRADDFDFRSSTQQWLQTELTRLHVGGTASILRTLLHRKMHQHFWSRDDDATFTKPSWAQAYPDVAHGGRVPLAWESSQTRTLALQLLNTQRPLEVVQAVRNVLGWFGFGSGRPFRTALVAVGDWVLYRNTLSQGTLTVDERSADARAAAEKARARNGGTIGAEAVEPTAPETTLADEVPQTTEAVRAFAKKARGRALSALAQSWGFRGDMSKYQHAAGLGTGSMQISGMSKPNCEKLLLYFVTHRNHADFKEFHVAPAEPPAPAPEPQGLPEDVVLPGPARGPEKRRREDDDTNSVASDDEDGHCPACDRVVIVGLGDVCCADCGARYHLNCIIPRPRRHKKWCCPDCQDTRDVEAWRAAEAAAEAAEPIDAPAARPAIVPRAYVNELIEANARIDVDQSQVLRGDRGDRYAKYMAAQTAGEYETLGGTRDDMQKDLARRYVTVHDATLAGDPRLTRALVPAAARNGAAAGPPGDGSPADGARGGPAVGPVLDGHLSNNDVLQRCYRTIVHQGRQAGEAEAPAKWDPLRTRGIDAVLDDATLDGGLRPQYKRELEAVSKRGTVVTRQSFAVRWAQRVLNLAVRLGHSSSVEAEGQHQRLLNAVRNEPAQNEDLDVFARVVQGQIDECRRNRRANEALITRARACLATVQAEPQDVDGTEAAEAAQTKRAARIAALAHPELTDVYSVPDLWHLMDYGGMKVIYKLYFQSLFKYCGQDVLHRTGIAQSADLYFPTSELFYHVWDALFILVVDAYKRSEAFDSTSPDAWVDGFIGWYRACWDSGDVPFRHYGGYLFGVGLYIRTVKQTGKSQDTLMTFAMLLIHLGLCKSLGRHNLRNQSFLSLAQFMSLGEPMARRFLTAVVVSRSTRPFHSIWADEGLETHQGIDKGMMGSTCSVARVQIFTALSHFLSTVKGNADNLTVGGAEKNATPGGRAPRARRDVDELVLKLGPYCLFDVDARRPRDSLGALPRVGNPEDGYLVPKDYNLPATHVSLLTFMVATLEHDNQPAFQFALKAATDLLEKVGVVERGAQPIEIDDVQPGADAEEEEEERPSHCGICCRSLQEDDEQCSLCGNWMCLRCSRARTRLRPQCVCTACVAAVVET